MSSPRRPLLLLGIGAGLGLALATAGIIGSARTTSALPEGIVARVPAPVGDANEPLQALVVDSYFDAYRGAVSLVRVFNGELRARTQAKLLHANKNVEIKEVGSFNPKPFVRPVLGPGESGYFTANIKSPLDIKIGDTLTTSRNSAEALDGFQEIHPMVLESLLIQ